MRTLSISLSALALSGAVACGGAERGTTESDIGTVSESLVTVKVLTQHNDNARTGANLSETALTPANVGRLGRVFSLPIQGAAYAQPLYVPNVTIAGKGTHNVIYVATMHNLVYAFDADDATQTTPLWQRQLEAPVPLPDAIIGTACNPYRDIEGEIGILATPVIDPSTSAMYFVTATKPTSTTYAHYVHKIDIRSGADLRSGTRVSGTSFQSQYESQRAAMTLANGQLYIGFAGYCDTGPYHGFLFAYDAATFSRTATYNASTDGAAGGIWQGGQGPSVDASGNVYVMTGNGTSNLQSGGRSAGMAFLKLSPSLGLLDWFVPHDFAAQNDGDLDLGASGALLMPGTNLVVGGGKAGKLYVVNTGNFGHYRASDDGQIVQSFFVHAPDAVTHHIHGSPVYWNGPKGPTMYIWPENDNLKAYHLSGKTFDAAPAQNGAPSSPGMPGGMLAISASGASNGILWASHPSTSDANQAVVEGELHAYDAADVTRLLWSSKTNPIRDNVGNFPKFNAPTIANGKVYVPTLAFGVGLENQATLADTSIDGPALATISSTVLAVAWAGTDPAHSLNVGTSSDALHLDTKTVLADGSAHTPALAYGNGRLYLAFSGNDGILKLKSSADGQTFDATRSLGQATARTPALAYGNGRLFVAWVDSATRIHVSSSKDGVTFSNHVVLAETTFDTPALSFFNGTLYLLWPGTDPNHTLNLESSTDGVAFGNKITLPDSSDLRPALAAQGSASYFVWTGRDDAHSLNGEEGDATAQGFSRKVTFPQTAVGAPSLALLRGALALGWTGSDGRLNLVRINPADMRGYGRLNVYGVLP